jgi:ABC-type protease/lipase transport system fused ATPase/permease subunit
MAAVPGVRRSELGDALRACRAAFIGVGIMSCMINLLYLIPAFGRSDSVLKAGAGVIHF